jgi:hypothetical protein
VFDPTIYDNLKVVFEGSLYDLDRDGRLVVTGREDLIDLAGMSRRFVMRATLPEGRCAAEVELSSGLLDFAGELRALRLAEETIGCKLKLTFFLQERLAEQAAPFDEYLREVWGEEADVHHTLVQPVGPSRRYEQADGEYRISLLFRKKIDEDNIADVEPLLLHLVSTLEWLEEQGGKR